MGTLFLFRTLLKKSPLLLLHLTSWTRVYYRASGFRRTSSLSLAHCSLTLGGSRLFYLCCLAGHTYTASATPNDAVNFFCSLFCVADVSRVEFVGSFYRFVRLPFRVLISAWVYEKMSLLVAKEKWQKNDSECMIGLSERKSEVKENWHVIEPGGTSDSPPSVCLSLHIIAAAPNWIVCNTEKFKSHYLQQICVSQHDFLT